MVEIDIFCLFQNIGCGTAAAVDYPGTDLVSPKAGFEQHHQENPEYAGIHWMTADTVEECWQLLRQSTEFVGANVAVDNDGLIYVGGLFGIGVRCGGIFDRRVLGRESISGKSGQREDRA